MTQSPENGVPPYPEFDRGQETPEQWKPAKPDETPGEVRSALIVLTALAAVLVFFGVLYLVSVDDLRSALRTALDSADQGMTISDAQLRVAIQVIGGLLVLLGLGNGLTAQGLRGRRRWARPVGYVAAGPIVVLGLLALGTGNLNVPVVILTGLAAVGVYLLSKPAVRDYLSKPAS